MKIDANDPRWTAYALGELEDERERAELESILKESEEMRQLVEEIRETAGWLNEGLRDESPLGLTQSQRERIESQSTKRKAWFLSKPVWALSGAAAALALGLSIWMYQLDDGILNSGSPDSQIADLREERSDPDEAPRSRETMRPEVQIPAQSVTVVGPAEEESAEALIDQVAEPEAKGEAGAGEASRRAAGSSVSGSIRPEIPSPVGTELDEVAPLSRQVKEQKSAISNEKAKTQDILATESSSSTGTILPADAMMQLPAVSKDVTEPENEMGGVANTPVFAGVDAKSLDIQQDGITLNKARYNSGLLAGARINPSQVREFRAVQSAVDAERDRASESMEEYMRQRRIWKPAHPAFNSNTEGYAPIQDNPFLEVVQNPLSTFSVDVDTASYANVRRFLEQSQLPPRDAIRIEELVNYFDYDYKGPGREGPFAAHFEMTEAPWNSEHRLLRIGLKAKVIEDKERPKTNLVFLIDVSGSMSDRNKLPLVQDAMHMLVDRLTENDRVSIVTYAGSTRVELPSTRGDRKWEIHRAIDRLRSGGSTAGASGIQLAYETAARNFIKDGANRVILATDGDFNVGVTNHGDLARLIEEKAESGVFLSALGFGMGNYKDDTLELLADKGRGNYAYIDTIEEARKVLVEQINATLVSVAKDVKIQVEFNPEQVAAYRLLGYENRIMAKEDFNDDTKKAGVIGAGHAVTALYEIVPAGQPVPSSGVDPLKYQKPVETTTAASSDETGTVKVRYKDPDGEESRLMQFAVRDSGRKFDKASNDFKFAASVAAFGMVLRDSPYKGGANLEDALDWAREGQGEDAHGYRAEFIRLVHRAISIKE